MEYSPVTAQDIEYTELYAGAHPSLPRQGSAQLVMETAEHDGTTVQ
jgi:hypothetical protein